MNNSMFVPKKIKVGFQNRQDTYTKKLAYVIYYDEKNKLRKEYSWNNWRDQKIDPVEFDNKPTSGFVLNKKVGGYKSDWNFRNAYVRIYDPRDFEFEITVPNLLYILENTNSIKGKGLEGEFIYGWNGTDLILIPTSCPNYVELSKINELRHSNKHIKSKELILGATYKHKSNTNMIYMGRFNVYEQYYWDNSPTKDKGLHYYFYEGNIIHTYKSLGSNFLEVVDNNCVSNYAELFDKLETYTIYSPIDRSKTEYIPYTLEEIEEKFKNGNYFNFFFKLKNRYESGYISRYSSERYELHTYNWYPNKIYTTLKELTEEYTCYYKKEYLMNGKVYNGNNY